MKTDDRHSVWFCSSCNGMADNVYCLLSILDGLDFMFGEKHWNRGAIKCLDILIEGWQNVEDFGRFEVICWN